MKNWSLLLAVGFALSSQSANAQFNINSDEGNVNFGPDGITINQPGSGTVKINSGGITSRKGNKTINLNSAGVTGSKTRSTVHVNSSGVNGNNSRNSVEVRSTGVKVKKGSSTASSTTVTSKGSFEDRIGRMEIQVYGKKTAGTPMISRVEKLELDNIGNKGTGVIGERISKLELTLGIAGGDSTTSTTTTVRTTEVTPGSGSITTSGNSVNLTGTGGSLNINTSGAATGNNIILDNSNFEGNVTCSGGNVVINASNCRIKFVGPVQNLVINGSENTLTCDSVRHVQANGSENNVTWSAASNPSIANVGSDNSLRSR